jgi:amino acid adenylation domain-containing protein
MVLLAAFFAFLRRYTGQDDFIVGSPTAGRGRPEVARLVGYFVNPVAMRASLSSRTTFRSLISQVRSTVLEALEHQELPFARLVEQLQPSRDPGRAPLFQTMFVLQRGHLPGTGEALAAFALGEAGARMRLGSLELESLPLVHRSSAFDLTLMLAEADGGLSGSLEYCTDLFDAATAARMAKHFEALLAAVVAEPERRVEEVELLAGEERTRVLEQWSQGPCVEVPVEGLARLLEDQVALRPEAVALEGGGQRLSYRELGARAWRLAHRLRREGVGPEVRVGVLLEKSVEAVVAFWGVQLAGGVYLPLEAVQPRERLEWMARDAGVRAVVTVRALEDRCGPPEGARVVRLEELTAEDEGPLESGVRADNAAYVLYTSGSTGRPKGVEVTHAGLCDLAYARMRAFGVGEELRLLQLSSLGFDASIWEYLLTMSVGGTLCVPEGGRVPLGEELRRALVEGAVTMVTLPPSVLALLPDEGLERLRVVKSVGEACPPELVEKWGRGRRFVNGYGPTETSVCVSWAECVPGEGRPSIGAPLANVRAYVLDGEMRPVPPGMAGELYLGGPGLARGYAGRPELTAERFVPDPFSQKGGERLYRTGDVVRWRTDGRLDYVGRADAQVKVNGVRVEPGEVEAALREVAGARQAHVRAWKSPSGESRLVAYVVPGAETPRETRELRALLRQRLPESMVPSAFVHLEALPLSSSGKVDGRALPPPEPPADARSASFVPPRSPLEVSIARCWAQALGREAVGLHDHFFDDLGGSSLTVVRACALLRDELRRDVPVVYFFEHPTVHGLARRLDPAVSPETHSSNHQDRAEARRQALQRRNPRGSRGNG